MLECSKGHCGRDEPAYDVPLLFDDSSTYDRHSERPLYITGAKEAYAQEEMVGRKGFDLNPTTILRGIGILYPYAVDPAL
jgi:hypothetical protein